MSSGVRGAASSGVRGAASSGVRGAASSGVRGAMSSGVRGAASSGGLGAASSGVRGAASSGGLGAASSGGLGAASSGGLGAASSGGLGAASSGGLGAASSGGLGAASSGVRGAASSGGLGAASSGVRGAAAAGQTPTAKRRGGRIVQSRYLQFDKKYSKKVPRQPSSGVAQRKAEKDASSSSSSSNSSLPSSRTKARLVVSQKHETSASVELSSLNQGGLEKGDLQSTLLGEGKMKLPDLDISDINDKSDPKKSSYSESGSEEDSETKQISGETDEESDSCGPLEELESETLMLTFLRLKIEKNVAKMEEKAEKNLLMLCEEKRRQEKKLWELKREILLQEREQKLNETLDKQIEVLSPLVAVCKQFKEQYKSFAASLDATRHELPIKNIHIEGDKQTYLDELGKQLMITQELLTEVMPSHSEDSAKALGALKELQEVSQQLSKGLQRSFTDVQNLSFEASKEVSLHNQYVCEEKHGVDVVKRWYFN